MPKPEPYKCYYDDRTFDHLDLAVDHGKHCQNRSEREPIIILDNSTSPRTETHFPIVGDDETIEVKLGQFNPGERVKIDVKEWN